jgi:hypothetical protein
MTTTKTAGPKRIGSGVRTVGTRGKLDVSVLLQEGVVTLLECGRWRAEERLTLKDLCMEGIESDLLSQYVTLGRKSLIDPVIQRELNTIESAARYAVKRFSLETPFGLFITAAAYPVLEKEMDKFERLWFEGRDKLVAHIKNHEQDITATYKTLALSIFNLMKHSNVSAQKKATFASQYARRILKAMPTAAEVFNSFHFSFQAFKVPMPTILDQQLKAEFLKDKKVQEKLHTLTQKEQQVREMNERIAARFEKNKEEMVDRFLTDVNKQVRGKVFDAVTAALHTISKHKRSKDGLQGRTVSQLNNMIKSFRMVNILNDGEVEKAVDKLEKELAPKTKSGKVRTRDLAQITEILSEIKEISQDQLLDMGYIGRSPRGDIIADHAIEGEGIELPDTSGRRYDTIDLAEEVEA